jgi:hypothetical protein
VRTDSRRGGTRVGDDGELLCELNDILYNELRRTLELSQQVRAPRSVLDNLSEAQ